jgi:exosome complex exonuclease DIS3/RRP44
VGEGAVLSMEDFISMNMKDHPELVNYMGFT